MCNHSMVECWQSQSVSSHVSIRQAPNVWGEGHKVSVKTQQRAAELPQPQSQSLPASTATSYSLCTSELLKSALKLRSLTWYVRSFRTFHERNLRGNYEWNFNSDFTSGRSPVGSNKMQLRQSKLMNFLSDAMQLQLWQRIANWSHL